MNLNENWTLLLGKEGEIRILSVVLEINFKKISNAEFNHSAVYSLVFKDGFLYHESKESVQRRKT